MTHPDSLGWRKISGRYGDAFFGQLKHDRSAGVTIYRFFDLPGVNPLQLAPPEGALHIEGTLGVFQVDWYQESLLVSPRFSRSAQFDFRTWIVRLPGRHSVLEITEKMSVFVYGDEESQVERLVAYLGGLKLFRERMEEIDSMR